MDWTENVGRVHRVRKKCEERKDANGEPRRDKRNVWARVNMGLETYFLGVKTGGGRLNARDNGATAEVAHAETVR